MREDNRFFVCTQVEAPMNQYGRQRISYTAKPDIDLRRIVMAKAHNLHRLA